MEEIRLMYPEIIVYALVMTFLFLFAYRKKKKFKKGVIVANTGYVKKTSIYKMLKIKYVIYNFFIVIVCVSLIIIGSIITARLYKEDKKEEVKEYYNRDIILCLDYSGSMGGVVRDIVNQYIEIVKNLKGDRFGIVVFGGAPSTILPLTDDYNYAISVLERLNGTENVWNWTGMSSFSCCDSSDGDGLAASVLNFEDDSRTKIVVLAADHGVDSFIVSLPKAVELAKDKGVKVYYVDCGIDSSNFMNVLSQAKVDATKITGGKYYDSKTLSVTDIVKDIETLDRTLFVEKNVETVKIDLPEILFPYLLLLTAILFVLDWRVRI